jgi:hypothetical protein
MLIARPLDLKTVLRYHATLDDYFRRCRELDGTDCYEGDEELPWSFWEDDVDHLHPQVVCEILPRAWENGDDVLTTVHNEGGKHECYSYILRSSLTRLLYIIEISENMGIERITQYEDDTMAEVAWKALVEFGSYSGELEP